MQLTLRYHPAAQRPACAAFLCGTDSATWLREISRWGLPLEQLSCYLVPESIRSVEPAGLFVVATTGAALPPDVLEPYGAVAGRLYIPVRATLWPATTPAELGRVLLWPRQFWHPSIGLIGFESKDELDLGTLLDCGLPRPANWSLAQPGLAPKPRLQRIRVQPPTAEEVVQAMQQDVGTTPLAQLPGQAEAQTSRSKQLLDNLRWRLLQTSLSVLGRLQKWLNERIEHPSVFPAAPNIFATIFGVLVLGGIALFWLFTAVTGNGKVSWAMPIVLLIFLLMRGLASLLEKSSAGAGSTASRPARQVGFSGQTPLGRLQQWLSTRADDLEKKRQSELERLLRLFSENMEEALKYAIPLDSPYQDRGVAPPSAQLGLRATDFNLRQLGGGGRADVWDLDRYRFDLQQQYLAAARQEALAGRHKKAAYIHAHLLGDFHAAANVLEEGGFFREAAALYRDHLHNLPAAAQCLERGGLLLEAAELFADQQQHEKAGDLYRRLEQDTLAIRHYERSTEQFLSNLDHPEAARVLADKLERLDQAQEVLLDGWAHSKQPETCLQQYFDVVMATPGADLSGHVRTVFQQRTPYERRVSLLQVLATVTRKHPAPTLLAASREVAYEVVGGEARSSNPKALSLLHHFLPDDRLIAADCSRYATTRQRLLTDAASSFHLQAPQLDSTIHWRSAVSHGNQWVAVGIRDNKLHVARGNWYGNVEYYSWVAPVETGLAVVLVADEYHSTRILLRPSETLPLETKHLPKNKYFTEALTVECPIWLPPWPMRVALLPNGDIATAQIQGKAITVQPYSAQGELLAALTYNLADQEADFNGTERTSWPCELIYRNGGYYTYIDNWLVWLAEDQRYTVYHTDSPVYQIVVSPYSSTLQLVAFTPDGCLSWEPTRPVENATKFHSLTSSIALIDLRFVGPEHLVFVGEQAELYHLATDGLHLVRSVPTASPPVAVLTADRQRFALLEESGCLSLYHFASE